MQLSVIIVNYNVKYFLEHCLLSVMKACKEINAEIFVVDNNSKDGSKEYLEPKFPGVHFHWLGENIGFAKANNQMLKHAKGEYILFLNPDTIVPEDCFTKCLSFFENHSDCGALGVRMIDGSGAFLKESKRALPTPAAGFYKMTGMAKAFPASKTFAGYYAGHLPEKENNKTEILAGAFMMLSKKAISITAGFDEDFFMYGEDIDLSYRILKAGMYNYYLGEVTIIHFKGESTQKQSPDYAKRFYGAMKIFIYKHYSHNKLKRSLMKSVIISGKKIAALRKNALASEKNIPINGHVLVVGDANEEESLRPIIAHTKMTLIRSSTNDHNPAENISAALNEQKIKTLIFCEGGISNKSIIEILPLLPQDCLVMFHQNGAQSIIGSNDKNKRGVFIAGPE